jgi:Tetracyclin repressor-like, C-terminal domain
MLSGSQIQSAYIDYVLTHNEQPKSVYTFAKKLKMTEADFYQFYSSFTAIERAIWADLTITVIAQIKDQEIWPQYSSREKILSFFYGLIEVLKSQRSFVVYTLSQHGKKLSTPEVLTDAKAIFDNFSEDVLNDGLDSGELAERKYFSKRYKDALWVQFAFIVNFWAEDDSNGFEKTDEAIEKGINLSFDLFQRSPIDNLFEYGKFLARNSKLKEKMGI